MRTVLVGAGRLATNLGRALRDAGHDVMCVYSRTQASAEALATLLGCRSTTSIAELPAEADLFIVSVKDDALAGLIPQLVEGREGQVFVHTAGSMSMSLFEGHASRYGVFYPMQSFSKERLVDFRSIPLFLEASDAATLNLLKTLAATLTDSTYVLSSDERQYLHLAAVFACNFVNHCYARSAEVLERHGIPFDVMLPLIDETARKVHHLHPRMAQTGPAVRYDEGVLSKQRQLLADNSLAQAIYDLMSRSIHEVSG